MQLIARFLAWLIPAPCKHVLAPGEVKCRRCGKQIYFTGLDR